MRPLCWLLALACFGFATAASAEDFPKMNFNETREVAPGVYFRYSSISATDLSVPFGGSNHIWIIFNDYVVVIDANFPKEAADVIKDIRKTTDKPIKFVLDTHHHGDHAYGNAVWAKEGATIVGQTNCMRLMNTVGPDQYKLAGQDRKDIKDTPYKAPDKSFDDVMVIEDAKQRVEFRFFGHGHTPGDACAYLPKHKILCTGDACVNGAFNYMGHADSASWIRALDKMDQLDIKWICPGHGPVADKGLLAKQKRYFVDMRQQIQKGIDAKQPVEDIAKGLNMPWYKEWTGKDASAIPDNVKHVYGELTGKIDPKTLGLNNLLESDSYWRETPGWLQPRRILVPNLSPTRLAELREIAPGIEFVTARTAEDAREKARTVDAIVGQPVADGWTIGSQVRWIHVPTLTRGEVRRRNDVTLTSLPSDRDPELAWQLCRENVRRFARGEKLLGVVLE